MKCNFSHNLPEHVTVFARYFCINILDRVQHGFHEELLVETLTQAIVKK